MLPDFGADRERWRIRQPRNCLTFDTASETSFVVGNRDGFRLTGNWLSQFRATDGALMALRGDRLRLGTGTGRHGTPGHMLIEGLGGS